MARATGCPLGRMSFLLQLLGYVQLAAAVPGMIVSRCYSEYVALHRPSALAVLPKAFPRREVETGRATVHEMTLGSPLVDAIYFELSLATPAAVHSWQAVLTARRDACLVLRQAARRGLLPLDDLRISCQLIKRR